MLSRILSSALAIALLAIGQVATAQTPPLLILKTAVDTVGRQTVRQMTEAIGEQITQRDAEMAEDEEARNSRVWASFAYQNLSIDGNQLGSSSSDFEADLPVAMLGADHRFRINDSHTFTIGVGGAYTRMLGEIAGAGGGEVEGNIWTFAPYLSWNYAEMIYVSLAGGYQEVSRVTRTNPIQTKSDIGFLQFDVRGAGSVGIVEGSVISGYRLETGSHTIVAGGDIGPRLGRVKPFVRVRYEGLFEELARTERNLGLTDSDRHSAFVGGGISFDVSDALAIEVRGWTELGDADIDNHQGVISLTGKF